ncbi:MAG TPA: hypothetical protein DCY91_17455 [Cyanobacteria bacterium UBA11370]|nr:hypothetical protein [Cyanobacteria bacterium UBA11370]HBY76074.1 hypothetical protein [Cyanobacteria bacterium UBA11148]
MPGDFQLNTLKPHYEQLFATCQLRKSWLDRIGAVAETIVTRRSLYDQVERQTNVPWWFIGILHYREANFGEAHLHNGDPLNARTVHDPPGRPQAFPANGQYYTFVESAVDAIRWKMLDRIPDRSLSAWLWSFEYWDGFGYAMHGINSEYLWNGTNHFGSGNNRGKCLPNGLCDPNATSDQVGCGAILWYIYHKGMLNATQPTGVGATHQPGTVSTPSGQSQGLIELVNAFRYYKKLPHQDAAIAWLETQQSPAVLNEFARRWREAITPTALGLQSVNQSVAVGANGGSAAVATAPPPVTRPQPRTLEERIIAYCEDKGYQIDRGPGEKNIIYVEGMYPDGQLNDDKANAWNDTRMVIEFKDGKPVVLGKWEATTEPGRYYTMNPMNAGGVARIAFGQHRAWQLGRHGQADPHEALVQTGGPLTVYRDLNKDGMRSGDRTDTGHFGVNQHWGGDSPKDEIGRWSAGCLVGRTRAGHREFMSIIKQDPRFLKNRGYVFSSIVIDGTDFFQKYPPS